MRMWSAPPSTLCRKHLLGEHVEMHMFVGTINRGISLRGYVVAGLVETAKIKERHDALVEEMKRRGYEHKSRLDYHDRLALGRIDEKTSLSELHRRCATCRALYRRKAP